jgi:uncharacterized lipoprotein YddW (UPF0748 family)
MEIRGIWITRDNSDVLKSKNGIRAALEKLKKFGFNTVYPCVWHSGYTLYPSAVAERFMGSNVHPEFESFNLIEELLKVSKELNLRIIPWFEFGLMVAPNSPIDRLDDETDPRYEGLISKTNDKQKIRKKPSNDGTLVDDEFVWMNPCHPLVQTFMINLMEEMAAFEVDGFQIDGIQLDDHFGWPKELGYEKISLDAFDLRKNKTEDRITWGTKRVTALMRLIFEKIKEVRPKTLDCIVSISPQPIKNSKNNYRLDWSLWEREGLAEEIIFQNYNPNSFNDRLNKKEVEDSRKHIPTAIGINVGKKDGSVPLKTIKSQIKETRDKKFSGVSFFYYETFFNDLRSTRSGHLNRIPRDETELKKLFE